MNHTLARADVSHYYQRLAELSTLPFWQREEFTEPAGPERGHVWHWQDVYPELARSRQLAADASGLQRRALILCNPGLTAPAAGATATIAAAYQMLFPGESAPVHAHSISAIRFRARGQRRPHDHRRGPRADGTGRPHPSRPAGAGTATSIPAATSPRCGWTASTSRSCWACGRASSATTRTPATRCPSGTPREPAPEPPRRSRPAHATDSTARSAATRGTRPTRPCRRLMARSPGPPGHQPGARSPLTWWPGPGHPGLPAPGPACLRPDPAAPGNRKLGHRGGPRHRDAHLRRPDLRAVA